MTSDDAEPSLAEALRAYVDARAAALLAARRQLRIGDADARALLYLLDHPRARPSELGAYLGASSAGVTTLTDRLVQRGVVKRESDELDRRSVRLTVTVDATEQPWSSLTRFDSRIDEAIGAGDAGPVHAAAALLRGLVRHAQTSG